MAGTVRFIRKNGRIIPIAAAMGGSTLVKASVAGGVHHHLKKQGVKPIQGNPYLKIASELLVTSGGFASGAALRFGGKGLLAGAVADEGVGLAASGLGVAAFAGKGKRKERAAGMAKQELKLQALGWGAFGAGALSSATVRSKVADGARVAATATAGHARKILEFARKALRVAE